MSNTIKAHILLIISAILHALNFLAAKEVMNTYIHPLGLIMLRVLVSGLLFWILGLFFSHEKLEKKEFITLFWCAFLGLGANIILFFYGLSFTTISNGALIVTASPVLVLLLAVFLGKEKMTKAKAIGISLAFGGVMLLMKKSLGSFHKGAFIGDLMVFINALFYAVYLIIARPILQKRSPITVFRWLSLFSFIVVAPFCMYPLTQTDFSIFNTKAYAIIGFITIFATFGTYLINAFALRIAESSLVGAYIYLQPLLAIFFGVLLNREVFSMEKLIIGGIIFGGVYLVSKKSH